MTAVSSVTGSIARAARVLDALALVPEGAGLAEIVTRTQFTKTTTFRVLAALQDVSYVFQDPESREYRLGTKLAELSLVAARTDIAALAERSMKRLAAMSEDTVFLSVPEGAAAICVARHVGAFPIRTLTLDKGDRRPLGVGAGSLALYCAMEKDRRAAVCRVNKNWLSEYGFTRAMLEDEHAVFEARGYAVNQGGVVRGMSAVGVPVFTPAGKLAAAIAIGAINERMDGTRVAGTLIPAMQREADLISERLNELER